MRPIFFKIPIVKDSPTRDRCSFFFLATPIKDHLKISVLKTQNPQVSTLIILTVGILKIQIKRLIKPLNVYSNSLFIIAQ